MCKWCDRQLYYDITHYYPDAGYGDDDIIEKTKNEVYGTLVCPVCGKITKYAIDKYGRDGALRLVLNNNLISKTSEEYNELLNKLKLDDKNVYEQFLIQNNFYIDNDTLYHECGKEILKLSNLKVLSISYLIDLINNTEYNYCSRCGKQILPLNTKILLEQTEEPMIFPVETVKIK